MDVLDLKVLLVKAYNSPAAPNVLITAIITATSKSFATGNIS